MSPKQLYALRCVQEKSGLTQREYDASFESDDPREISRRLHELEKLGLIVQGMKRKCKVSGKKSSTWWITEKGNKALPKKVK